MNSNLKRWLLPFTAIVVLLLIVAWMAGSFRDKISPGLLTPETDVVAEAITVETVAVDVTEPVPATIGARQATTISSRILARITDISVRAGDAVAEGQLLVSLENSDLLSRASQSREQVRAVTARLTEARQSLERAEQLYEQKLVAASVLDEARAKHDALNADLASARQAVQESEVALSFTDIRSPINGRVVDRFAEPGDTASPGDKLLTLYNPTTLRIEAAVREGLALSLELGQALTVEIPSLERTMQAHVEELVPAADPGSRSFLVKARVGQYGELLPGMYARLQVPAGSEKLLLVPTRLLTRLGQLDLVWVVDKGRAERRFIRTGRHINGDSIEVLAGLEPGDRIIPKPAR
jgi:RND family efflux transporter MFP subunit